MKKTVFVTMIMLGTALVMQAQQVYDKFLEDGKTGSANIGMGTPMLKRESIHGCWMERLSLTGRSV